MPAYFGPRVLDLQSSVLPLPIPGHMQPTGMAVMLVIPNGETRSGSAVRNDLGVISERHSECRTYSVG